MRLLAKGKGQVVGLNRVIKLSHMEKVRFEQKLKGEQVRETPERRALWTEEATSPKALKQESACEQQGGQYGWMRVRKGEESKRQVQRGYRAKSLTL